MGGTNSKPLYRRVEPIITNSANGITNPIHHHFFKPENHRPKKNPNAANSTTATVSRMGNIGDIIARCCGRRHFEIDSGEAKDWIKLVRGGAIAQAKLPTRPVRAGG
ncbi:MAG TPA: hypothetical protein VFC26_10370 [Verrucomicrobiae bacterium]|nr:hypothetical protein [Verrucomicrobiae bacterium]